MTERVNDAFKHCFSHICVAGGVSTILDMTETEALHLYVDPMMKDLKDCGVEATEDEVRSYIKEQLHELKKIEANGENLVRM